MKFRIHYDVFTGLFLLIISLCFYFMSAGFPSEGKLFPVTIIVLLLLFSVLIMFSGIKKTLFNKEDTTSTNGENEEAFQKEQIKIPLITLFLIVVYIILIGYLGFFVSTILFMTTVLLLLKVKGIKGYLFTVIGTTLFLYILFVKLLHVAMPTGLLF
ncbi:tripartite tricarboxylate transporter TctB family protein [Pseudogracilibacillus sp. SO10305]|uniref:tripartite tricarboxylate transporter TctB family protein n=1 Tax=Pseudogracilibacillus sp. SO10305 TaxID=3098292 RepID=UPI00300DCDD9